MKSAKRAMVKALKAEDRNMTGKLAGKVIVVSGGTQGLGEAVARQVVADGAAGLVIAGRSPTKGAALAAELTALGTPTSFIEADMADPPRPEGRLPRPTPSSASCTVWSTLQQRHGATTSGRPLPRGSRR